MFGLSKRELEAKFMKSEVVLLAWRSQELANNMNKDSDRPALGKRRPHSFDVSVPEGLPDHFYNKDGEIDLRQVTGEEAYRYFSSQGIRLPIMGGR
jgi:hypothetical protein